MKIFESRDDVYYNSNAYLRKCKHGVLLVPESTNIVIKEFCKKFLDCDYKNCDLIWIRKKPRRFISLIGEEKYGN